MCGRCLQVSGYRMHQLRVKGAACGGDMGYLKEATCYPSYSSGDADSAAYTSVDGTVSPPSIGYSTGYSTGCATRRHRACSQSHIQQHSIVWCRSHASVSVCAPLPPAPPGAMELRGGERGGRLRLLDRRAVRDLPQLREKP